MVPAGPGGRRALTTWPGRVSPPLQSCCTPAGTHGYRAPEVYDKSYGSSADYWNVGVVLAEMLLGRNIYRGKDKLTSRRMLFSADRPEQELDDLVSRDAAELIRDFLERDPCVRLGSEERGGLQGIMEHPFFEGVDWNHLAHPSRLSVHGMPAIDPLPPPELLRPPCEGTALERIATMSADIGHMQDVVARARGVDMGPASSPPWDAFQEYMHVSPMLLVDELHSALRRD